MVYSPKKGVLCSLKEVYPGEVCNGKTMEPELIWNIAVKLLSGAVQKSRGTDIRGIGLSTLFPTLVALDNRGKPLTKIITWMDNRASGIVARFRKNKKQAISLYRNTGCVIHESYPLWKILHIRKYDKEIFMKAGKFFSLSEYLTYRLTGKFLVSKNIASTTGFFNIK